MICRAASHPCLILSSCSRSIRGENPQEGWFPGAMNSSGRQQCLGRAILLRRRCSFESRSCPVGLRRIQFDQPLDFSRTGRPRKGSRRPPLSEVNPFEEATRDDLHLSHRDNVNMAALPDDRRRNTTTMVTTARPSGDGGWSDLQHRRRNSALTRVRQARTGIRTCAAQPTATREMLVA